MQTRLIIALVGIALASVVLVGAGVVVLAQIGARESAEQKMATQLDALAEMLAGSVSSDQLDRARTALDLDGLLLVVVDEEGTATPAAIPVGDDPATGAGGTPPEPAAAERNPLSPPTDPDPTGDADPINGAVNGQPDDRDGDGPPAGGDRSDAGTTADGNGAGNGPPAGDGRNDGATGNGPPAGDGRNDGATGNGPPAGDGRNDGATGNGPPAARGGDPPLPFGAGVSGHGFGEEAGADELALVLEGDELDRYRAGQTIVLSDPVAGGTVIRAVRQVEITTAGGDEITTAGGDEITTAGGDETSTVGLLATRTVVAIGAQAWVWFLVSASSVLAASAIAAWILARQLSKPIRQIQRATTSIAAGDFEVRVDEDGHDELAELGQAVNRMARELERSKRLDQQFLMSVSHDLRTPLTAITGYAEALSDKAVSDTVHTGDVIRNHAYRLERLVGDLLDLARLDANRFQLHWQTLDVGVVVGRTVAGLARQAKRHDVHLDFDNAGPLFVRADADRLAQVVGNVVDNAIKFAATQIVASVRANGSHALIEICDDGPGIAPLDLPYVFERLYVSKYQPLRAESPSGMGLAIVRELTLAMGGTVAAGYRPGGGARMTLRLPLFC